MNEETERWLRDTLGPALNFFATDEDREKTADQRAEKVIRAVEEASKRQVQAIERGFERLARALENR